MQSTTKSTQKFPLISFLQVNLNHCKAATSLAAEKAITNNYDILLLQDPYVTKGRLLGFPLACRTHHSKDLSAWIVVVNCKLVVNFHSPFLTSVFATLDTCQGPLVIGTQYAPPRGNLNLNLAEWQALAKGCKNSMMIIGGDFNGKSRLWGARTEDARGIALMQQAAVLDLIVQNDEDSPPTFVKHFSKSTRTGWPDVTLASPLAHQHLLNWQVLSEEENVSDHKYISYSLGISPEEKRRRRFKTRFGNHLIFKNHLRSVIAQGDLLGVIKNSSTSPDLESATDALILALTQAASKAYRLRAPGVSGTTTWWTPQLATARNKLRALNRRHEKTKDVKEAEDLKKRIQQTRAIYKKLIITSRRKCWEDFCQAESKPYGFKFKLASGKVFRPHNIITDWKKESPQPLAEAQESLTKELFRCTPTADPPLLPYAASELPHNEPLFSKSELKEALYSLNPNKAPGYDNLDFTILRQAFQAAPDLILEWSNKCLALGHFPSSLKIGEVVFFHKEGKDPALPSSYRPICLLPTLGKMLEKLLQRRLIHHLEVNKHLSCTQHGFREAKSCESAIVSLLHNIENNNASNLHTMILSFDIKGAFDTVSWHSVKEALINTKCPLRTRALIFSFLDDRRVRIDWGAGNKDFPVYAGCPQGSCLGPILWLLIAEQLLKSPDSLGTAKLAFADDFIFVVQGRYRRELEENGKKVIQVLERWADTQGLTISPEKSCLMVVKCPKVKIAKRLPSLRYKDTKIKAVTHLRYLGVILDNKLSWKNHVNYLKVKSAQLNQHLAKVASRQKGLSTAELKHWYLVAGERALLYGASIWAVPHFKWFTKAMSTAQRPFLLKIAKAFITTPTLALQVLTGIPPLHLTAQKEAQQAQLLRGICKPNVVLPAFLKDVNIQPQLPTWITHPVYRHLDLKINKPKTPTSKGTNIYTDGSKTDHGVGAALAIYKEGELQKDWAAKLGNGCSVFQAELRALKQALIEASNCPESVTILTDSLSGLQALNSFKQKNSQVCEIKKVIKELMDRGTPPNFCWVRAHVGIQGNERADSLAKAATEWPDVTDDLPIPKSSVKRILKERLLDQWQKEWDQGTTGRLTHNYLPKIFTKFPITPSHAVTSLLTGHGPFLAYLFRFKRSPTPSCVCGDRATSEHYMFACPFTEEMHFKKPDERFCQEWTNKLLTNSTLCAKAKRLYSWLVENQDFLEGAM